LKKEKYYKSGRGAIKKMNLSINISLVGLIPFPFWEGRWFVPIVIGTISRYQRKPRQFVGVFLFMMEHVVYIFYSFKSNHNYTGAVLNRSGFKSESHC
jgi:hypothetical protein